MKIMVNRYVVTAADGRGPFWGTCEKWVQEFGDGASVVRQPVMVVRPRREPCGCCGGAHVVVPIPAECERAA